MTFLNTFLMVAGAAGHRHVALVVIARHLLVPRRHHKISANPIAEGGAWGTRFPRS
jgi:hypothetical protein